MRTFQSLCVLGLLVFGTTLGLDLVQQRPDDLGKQTIVFESIWSETEPMQQAYRQLFEEFERTHPEYRVEARWDGRWMIPAVRPRLLTNTDLPDIVNADRVSLTILVEEGYLEPLDEILASSPHPDDPDEALRDAILPRLLDGCAYEGGPKHEAGTYCLPAEAWVHLVFYNKILYEKLGLAVPKTWEAFMANCRRLLEAGVAPLAADEDRYAQMWPGIMLPRAVGEATLRQTVSTGEPRFDTDPRYRAVFEAIRETHRPGWFMDGWRDRVGFAGKRELYRSRAGHIFNGSFIARHFVIFGVGSEQFELGAFALPPLPPDAAGETEFTGEPNSVVAEIAGYALLEGATNKAGAVKLLEFLSRRESAEVLARVGQAVPATVGADVPPILREAQQLFLEAKAIYGRSEGLEGYGPKWHRFVFKDLYRSFYLIESPDEAGYLTVDEFLAELQRQTAAYIANGGEAGIQ